MANPDSERKPDDKERGARVSGTTYDWARVMLSFGTALFAVAAIATAFENQYFAVVYPLILGTLAVLFGCLVFYLGRKKRRPVGQDFNF